MSYELNSKLYYYVKNYILNNELENKKAEDIYNEMHIPDSIPINEKESEILLTLLEDKYLQEMKKYMLTVV